jgi:hypothetical protein
MMIKEQIMNSVGRVSRLQALNDDLRCQGIGGMTLVTNGIAQLPPDTGRTIYAAVAAFSAFTADNDPYGEHDCAALKVDGRKVIFKIDYYDRQQQAHSPDATDPRVTCRVLTIMLADEY